MSSNLRVDHSSSGAALLRFDFADSSADALRIACPRLAGPEPLESWTLDAMSGDSDVSAVIVEVEEAAFESIEAASAEAYRRLLGIVRPSQHPYLLRIWNYLGDINLGVGDDERYRRFCVGRAAAVDAIFNAPPPAATAIGTAQPTGVVQVIALCTRAPGVALENPRQTPAWQYPREFGPVAPGFSRGALLRLNGATQLLASGTASIVGHVSQHLGDARAQARESLANLEALLREGERHDAGRFALDRCDAARVYLRDPADLDAVREEIATQLPLDRVLFLHGDICRRELLVELEGVFRAG